MTFRNLKFSKKLASLFLRSSRFDEYLVAKVFDPYPVNLIFPTLTATTDIRWQISRFLPKLEVCLTSKDMSLGDCNGRKGQ